MLALDIRRMRYNVRIYLKLILLQLRIVVEYRTDFWIGVAGATMVHGAGLVFISAFFSRIPVVEGWTVWEVSLLYGLTMMAYGLHEIFCDGPWTLPSRINRGDFDRVLLRPISPALQTATAISSIHGASDFLLGLTVLVVAARQAGLDWTVGKVLWVILTVICGLVMVSAITFLTNLIGFWEPGAQGSLPFMIFNLIEFAKFPLELYGWVPRFLLTAVLPYGFISYYPSLILFDKGSDLQWLGYLTPLSPVLVVVVTAWLWRKGLARYQGVGH